MSQQQYAQEKLHEVLARIHAAEGSAGRDEGSVHLIGASKKHPPELIAAFAQAGLTQLGENYLQEAIGKVDALRSQNLNWHFIGQVQSNKTKLIANNFDWVHGVDRAKIASRLATQNTKPEPIKLLIQLNIDNEASKSGVTPELVASVADEIAQSISHTEGAELRGFMVIPKPRINSNEQQAIFAQARELMEQTNQQYGLSLDQLSMGMSGDLEAAIAEGATMVRIGTDLFGARK